MASQRQQSILLSILLWVVAVIFTASTAYFQRITGPTYPITSSKEVNQTKIKFKFPRSEEVDKNAEVILKTKDSSINAYVKYRRFLSHDSWHITNFSLKNGMLIAELPHQPAAGKIMYDVFVKNNGQDIKLNEKMVIIRYKGKVPSSVLIPHILFMFLAMLFSTRTILEGIFRKVSTYRFTFLTLIFLFIGGLILGPIVQKYAFDAYWTGWPFGQDLTDNKTLVAFIFWLVAFIRLGKNKNAHGWAIAAGIILLAVYLIPHSMFGSELDFTQMQE